MLQLIGQDSRRYGGFGFGNISCRHRTRQDPDAFIISGTQTGQFEELTPEHFATVLRCFPRENRVVAKGPVQPSSEAMTHATVYGHDPAIQFVIHAHSPQIWKNAEALGFPVTRPGIPYGTVEMTVEVARLLGNQFAGSSGIFSMGGHEDGIVAFGPSAGQAARLLIDALGGALQVRP
ncbi:class II aldolase/adducin family protein [Desulfuromonas sp.]|uniref:class II aldolase/adducin family protein n=1 Tax=Desulfuromonas sp. TaxID=892 RepID=UPI0025C0AA98|nr:class II aldolase/adducin family protein [Desulfuromonas sp.]